MVKLATATASVNERSKRVYPVTVMIAPPPIPTELPRAIVTQTIKAANNSPILSGKIPLCSQKPSLQYVKFDVQSWSTAQILESGLHLPYIFSFRR